MFWKRKRKDGSKVISKYNFNVTLFKEICRSLTYFFKEHFMREYRAFHCLFYLNELETFGNPLTNLLMKQSMNIQIILPQFWTSTVPTNNMLLG